MILWQYGIVEGRGFSKLCLTSECEPRYYLVKSKGGRERIHTDLHRYQIPQLSSDRSYEFILPSESMFFVFQRECWTK